MNSEYQQSQPFAAWVSRPRFSLFLAALALQGCALGPVALAPTAPPVVYTVAAPVAPAPPAPAAPAERVADEVDLLPPAPSFTTLTDCESAFGAGACDTGRAVYLTAGLTAPVGAEGWYIPLAFGEMRGVLINHYFAPPAAFAARIDYRLFIGRAIVTRYKAIDRLQIDRYRHAPIDVRLQVARSGPARYSPSRGVITGRLAAPRSSAVAQRPVRSLPVEREHASTSGTGGSPRVARPSLPERNIAHTGHPAASPLAHSYSEGRLIEPPRTAQPRPAQLQPARFQAPASSVRRAEPAPRTTASTRASGPTAHAPARSDVKR